MTSIVSGGDLVRREIFVHDVCRVKWKNSLASESGLRGPGNEVWARSRARRDPLRSCVREMEQRHERAFNERVYLASALFTRPSRAALRIIFLGP